MKRFVIDASVLVKLFFEEEHSDASVKYVRNAADLLAPDLLWAEATNVVWKRLRRGQITADNAAGLVQEMLRVPIVSFSSFDLAAPAMALAAQTDRTVYDCLYLALAQRQNVPLVSGDERLVNALANGPLGKLIRFVGR